MGSLAAQCGQWAALQARNRLIGLRAKEVMLMSFKIRMKMFIAESRTCVSAESCGKRVLLYRSLSVLFLHIRFLFAGGAADGPRVGSGCWAGLEGLRCRCLDRPQGECQDLLSFGRTWGCDSVSVCLYVCLAQSAWRSVCLCVLCGFGSCLLSRLGVDLFIWVLELCVSVSIHVSLGSGHSVAGSVDSGLFFWGLFLPEWTYMSSLGRHMGV